MYFLLKENRLKQEEQPLDSTSDRRCITSAALRNVLLDFFKFITEDWKSNGDVRKQVHQGRVLHHSDLTPPSVSRCPGTAASVLKMKHLQRWQMHWRGRVFTCGKVDLESDSWWKRHTYLISVVFASHCPCQSCRQMCFFSWPVKFRETQSSGRLLLMNVKSKADLFKKSKHFHTYSMTGQCLEWDLTTPGTSSHASVQAASCALLTRRSCDLGSMMINVESTMLWHLRSREGWNSPTS